jgi:hypothetical protein
MYVVALLVLLICISAFAWLAKSTPDSVMEEVGVAIVLAGLYFGYKFTDHPSRNSERAALLAVAGFAIAMVVVMAVVTAVSELIRRDYLPHLPRIWQTIFCVAMSLYAAWSVWKAVKNVDAPVFSTLEVQVAFKKYYHDIQDPTPPVETQHLRELSVSDWKSVLSTIANVNGRFSGGSAKSIAEQAHLVSLRRVYAAATATATATATTTSTTQRRGRRRSKSRDANASSSNMRGVLQTVVEEVDRLERQAKASKKNAETDDALSQAASVLEYGAGKLPELGELDMSDLVMLNTVNSIQRLHTEVEHIYVCHHQLKAIHLINRDNANAQCNKRAQAARGALLVLKRNNMRFSEMLIAAEPSLSVFQSLTGFQVVEFELGKYVTFEGNGRREALIRAFPDPSIEVDVEVRLYKFPDGATSAKVSELVRQCRSWKNCHD